MQLADSLRRGVRTFAQAFIGILLVLVISPLVDAVQELGGLDADELEFSFWESVVVSACLAFAAAIVTWLHNLLEDHGVIPSILKANASSGANPVTHDPVIT